MARPRAVLSLWLLCLPALAAPATTAAAAERPAVWLEVASLDELEADLAELGKEPAPAGEPPWLVRTLAGSIELADLGWVDRTRPFFAGVLLEQMGAGGSPPVVLALPAGDPAAALASLADSSSVHDVEAGIHALTRPSGALLHVRVDGSHLVLGTDRAAVERFAPAADGARPAGSIALALDLERLAPLAQMGLATVRERAAAAAGAAAPAGEPDAQDPETMRKTLDAALYPWVLLFENAARSSVALDVGGGNAILRQHVVPRAGSDLGTMLNEQPDRPGALVGLLPSGPHDGLATSSFRTTAAFEDEMERLLGLQHEMMRLSLAGREDGPASEFFEAQRQLQRLGWECQGGDVAWAFDLADGGGARTVVLSRVADALECRDLLETTTSAFARLAASESPSFVEVTPGALVHGGVSATRFDLDLAGMLAALAETAGESEAPDAELMSALVPTSSWMAVVGDVLVSVAGEGGEQRLRETIDRLRGAPGGGSVDLRAAFAPLDVAGGAYGMIDLGRILARLPEIPDDLRAAVAGIADRRIVAAARPESGGLTIEVAFPAELARGVVTTFRDSKGEAIEGQAAAIVAPDEPEGGPPPPAPPVAPEGDDAASAPPKKEPFLAGKGGSAIPFESRNPLANPGTPRWREPLALKGK